MFTVDQPFVMGCRIKHSWPLKCVMCAGFCGGGPRGCCVCCGQFAVSFVGDETAYLLVGLLRIVACFIGNIFMNIPPEM